MKKIILLISGMLVFNSIALANAEEGKDHPLVGRYVGSSIDQYRQSEFDEVKLLKKPLDISGKANGLTADNSLVLQGKSTLIRYSGPSGRSALEIFKNYESSLQSKGFITLFNCANEACLLDKSTSYYQLGGVIDTKNYLYSKTIRYSLLKLSRAEGDVYASVLVGESTAPTTLVHIVELKPMESGKIAFVDAGTMAADMNSSGKVALYGIFFDTGSSVIKPASATTLAEIAKLLKQQSSLSLIVTGHTDNQGEFGFNVDLSNKRAQAVKAALTNQYGIAASRLTAFGAGMASPTASNENEAGRTKNRRVELVKR